MFGILLTTLWGIKYDSNKNSFMSVEDNTFLRGFWCIIVVLVHVPSTYQNRIQDMLGSFAYIGVTFFFMASAFGLKWSLEHKTGYMQHFWRRRLPSILIPAVIANCLLCALRLYTNKPITIFTVINVNPWVKVLLVNYVIFWIVYYLVPKKLREGNWQNIVICCVIFLWSLVERLTGKLAMGWEVERLGFAYGLLLSTHYNKYNDWIHKRWMLKSIIMMLASGILGILYLRFKSVEFYGDYLLRILLGVVIIAFMIEIISRFRVGNKVNAFLGTISYEVYLLHEIVFMLIISIVPKLNSGLFTVGAVVITLFMGNILKKISETLKCHLAHILRRE